MKLLNTEQADAERAYLQGRADALAMLTRQASMYQHVAAHCHKFSVRAVNRLSCNYWQQASDHAAYQARFRLLKLVDLKTQGQPFDE